MLVVIVMPGADLLHKIMVLVILQIDWLFNKEFKKFLKSWLRFLIRSLHCSSQNILLRLNIIEKLRSRLRRGLCSLQCIINEFWSPLSGLVVEVSLLWFSRNLQRDWKFYFRCWSFSSLNDQLHARSFTSCELNECRKLREYRIYRLSIMFLHCVV